MTLSAPLNVVDYSDGRPRMSRLRALGYVGVCRYLWYRGITDPKKALTKAEADKLHAAGLSIVLNFESTATRMKGGRRYGAADAKDAAVSLDEFGVPKGRPVYFSADWDTTASWQDEIDAYLDGAASVLEPLGYEIGVYGEYRVLVACRKHATAKWFWQTYAWSAGQFASFTHLYQHQNHVRVAGATVDLDWAYQADYGGWGPALPDSSTEDPMDLSGFSIYATPKVLDVPKGAHLYTDLTFDESTAVVVAPGRAMPVVGKFDSGPFMVGLTPDDGSADPSLDWRIVRARDVPAPRSVATDCSAAVTAATDPLKAQVSDLEGQLSAAQAATDQAVADAIAKTKASAKVGVVFE